MEQNLKIINGYKTVNDLIQLLKTIPPNWVFVTLECDSECGEFQIACVPEIEKFIEENNTDLFDDLDSFDKDVVLHFKSTKDKEIKYEIYLQTNLTKERFEKLIEDVEPNLEHEFFKQEFVGKGSVWLLLDRIQESFDLGDGEEIQGILYE